MASNLGWVTLIRCVLSSNTSIGYRSSCGNPSSMDQAHQLFQWAYRLNPRNESAVTGIAWSLADSGQYAEALNWLDMIVRVPKPRDTVLHLYGIILYLHGDQEQALWAWRAAKSERFFWGQAERLYNSARDLRSAQTQYELAIKIAPQFSGPYLRIGQIYYAEGDLVRARKAFEMKISLEPDGESYAWLGNTLMRLGKQAEASAAYAQVAETDDVDAYLVVGDFYRTQGSLAEARNWYLQAYRKFPNDAMSAIKLGELALRETQLEQAYQYFQIALDRAPYNPTPVYYMGYWFFVSGDYDSSLVWIQNAFRQGLVADYWVYRTLGDVNAQLRRCDIALEMYLSALRFPNISNSEKQAVLDRMQKTDTECVGLR